ncbi:C40 family peptidase [Nocardioides antri]|uniref:NlpC/P60 family protein n=1 Tax=Nocardioides antri TaxID=2607659 RepID=A0A5B1M610_9ACTN|nr:C40 family peptidase [Nocardioides antri]KAA1428283.1 NlpC/P60 family protein [Nocardioides antri]
MRRPVIGTALLALVLVTAPASADPTDPAPSRGDVRKAERRAQGAAADVDSIQAQIDAANANLEAAAVAAQQAAEAYNGARWRLQEARKAERRAERASRRADRELGRVREDYRDTLLTTAGSSPDLDAFNAALDSDGFSSLLDQRNAADIVQGEFEEERIAFEAAADDAEDAEQVAEDAASDAEDAAADALVAKQDAEAAVAAAATAAQSVTAEKTRLLRRLARLEGISIELAEQRQAALEQEALEQAALEAQHEQAPGPEQPAPQQPTPEQPTPEQPDDTEPSDQDDPVPAPPPADEGGAAAAVSFARDQIGEPYVWAAAGPDAWDCSGLTMGAWNAGGRSLPHYSVAQYDQSSPISASDLRPGDLVFWGSSSSSSSIYHVALYAGDGLMIHAPRTGRPVTEESMYYWIPPNFFARP